MRHTSATADAGASDEPRRPDDGLVRAAQTGSRDAFEQLVRYYQPRLMTFIARYVDRRTHDPEDLVQETFLRAYRYLDGYNPRWAFSTWLFNIAVRVAIDERRRSAKRPTAVDVTSVSIASADAPPHARAMARDDWEMLWHAARACLSDEQHAMLWLTYREEMPIRDVARAVGKTRVAVRVGLHRARVRLARHLAAHEPEASSEAGHTLAEEAKASTIL